MADAEARQVFAAGRGQRHSLAPVLGGFIGIEAALIPAAYAAWRWADALLPTLAIVVVALGVWWKFASRDAHA